MYSAQGDTALPVPGFPIRASAGQSLFSGSPRLIAAVHALHRLLVPRHPPCALDILTVINSISKRRTPKGTSAVINRYALCGPGLGTQRASVIPVCWMTVQFSRTAEKAPAGDSGRRS